MYVYQKKIIKIENSFLAIFHKIPYIIYWVFVKFLEELYQLINEPTPNLVTFSSLILIQLILFVSSATETIRTMLVMCMCTGTIVSVCVSINNRKVLGEILVLL